MRIVPRDVAYHGNCAAHGHMHHRDKTAKVALVGVGLAFGSLQVLSYLGYVQLDYSKIEGEVMGALDIDKNGKVDTDDMKELYDRAMKVGKYILSCFCFFVEVL